VKILFPVRTSIIAIAKCPIKLAEIRQRLSNVSRWMRLLCQRVAQRANQEDEESGRFFQDRFRATRLSDEASLLACAAYVDLNPIRAAMCETLEESDYTSAQRRIESLRADQTHEHTEDASPTPTAADKQPIAKLRYRRDSLFIPSVDRRAA
jgi:hypothetical protein